MSDSHKPKIQYAVRARSASDDSTSSTSTSTTTPPNPRTRALSIVTTPSLKSPRAARFAEATAVNSPIEPSTTGKANFTSQPASRSYMAQPQVSDVGFGYVNKHESVEMPNTDYEPPLTAKSVSFPKTALKSAMKTPGAPPKNLEAMLSPTFREEHALEKHEQHTDKEQVKDLKIKTRVRVAKFLLRGVSFSCSLIVIGMLASTFAIFNATKALPPRNSLPPWAKGQQTWPQIMLLVIACISLAMCSFILFNYWRGGHKRAEKTAVYFTAFSVGVFIFTVIMWAIGAAVLQTSRTNGNNKDMWGWACVNNQRKSLFENEVDYELICRLQNWSLVCAIIEIVVEVIVIAVYGIVFYRFWTRRRLRKSMAARDRARSDLYLAQLRSQSAPNTPGGPMSPRDGGWRAPTTEYYAHGPSLEEGNGDVRYVDASQKAREPAAPFKLQAPPIRVTNATPKIQSMGFQPVTVTTRERERSRTPSPDVVVDQRSPLMAEAPREVRQEHFAAVAPGEQVYDSVPIPGAYEAPMSPGFEARGGGMNFPSR
ncbi:uncharacterized protein RCC_04335 [Ramularia collo-cygni]|uniref:Hyphal anastamosis-8 protein n=1 Tax=Ramularia collo-cygni TaxID=112498 RepID=A0A2D3UZ51_9PEZI|nr:uncharacterized protein RCC_04335 [Ramularia collo-cygni]CZT18490.1 uncharacterized protein RCC_04335 [Ramularia collo-cygni]